MVVVQPPDPVVVPPGDTGAGFPDCNLNNINDNIEIEQGLTDDCNGNGVPDDCDGIEGFDNCCIGISIGDTVEMGSPSPIAGVIETPGGMDCFGFNATAGQTVFFQSLGSAAGVCPTGGSITWNCTAPNGSFVFFNTNANSSPGLRTLPVAGRYTINVFASAGSVGRYSFGVLDASPEPQTFAIAQDTLVEEDMPAPGAGFLETVGARDIYTFPASAEAYVYFDSISTSDGSILWNCVNANGVSIFSNANFFGDPGMRELTLGGTYTINVTSTNGSTGTYSFSPRSATIDNLATVIGAEPVTGTIDSQTNVDRYTLPVVAPGTLAFFDAQGSTSGSILWKLKAPDGSTIFGPVSLNAADPGLIQFTQPGNHEVIVYASAGQIATYNFEVNAVNANDVFDIMIDQAVGTENPPGAGEIEAPGSMDIYTFDAPGSNSFVYFFADGDPDPNLRWQCKDANGSFVFNSMPIDGDDPGMRRLTLGGEYTIEAFGIGTTLGTYDFLVESELPPDMFAINLDDPRIDSGFPGGGSGNIEARNKRDVFTFTATSDLAFFDAFDADTGGMLQWECRGLDGSIVFPNRPFPPDGTPPGFQPLVMGQMYEITVTGVAGDTGDYEFEALSSAGNPPDMFPPIGVGDDIPGDVAPVSGLTPGVIDNPFSTDVYTFALPADDTLFFEVVDADHAGLRWSLQFEQNPILIFSQQLVDGVGTPLHPGRRDLLAGNYTLTFFTSNSTPGNYEVRILDVPAPEDSTAINPGDVVPDDFDGGWGTIENIDSTDEYLLTIVEATSLYFDVLSGPNTISWQMDDPNGARVFGPSLFQAPFGNPDPGLINLTVPGTYTIHAFSPQGATGIYSFQILDPASAADTFSGLMVPLTVSQDLIDSVPVSGAGHIEAPAAADVYEFTASAGQQVFFNAKPSDANILWSCQHESGQVVFNQTTLSDANDPGLLTLPLAGTYVIRVSAAADATGVYAFDLVTPAAPQTFAIEIGDRVDEDDPEEGAGTIELPGSMDVYTFSADAGERVFFEGFFGSVGNLRWSCEDEDGLLLFSNQAITSDFARTLTRGGIYTIKVFSANFISTATYAFEVTLQNDECNRAFCVEDEITEFDSTFATFSESTGCADNDDLWYRYVSECTGALVVSLCGSSFDTRLGVFEGCGCVGEEIDCVDDVCGLQSEVEIPIQIGDCVTIQVGGENDGELSGGGPGTLTVMCIPGEFMVDMEP
jgi:hypothetical protein